MPAREPHHVAEYSSFRLESLTQLQRNKDPISDRSLTIPVSVIMMRTAFWSHYFFFCRTVPVVDFSPFFFLFVVLITVFLSVYRSKSEIFIQFLNSSIVYVQ